MPISAALNPYGFLQLQHDADGGQGRLLRPRSVREDDQPPLHLSAHDRGLAGRDGLPRDGDRPHPLLRPAADRRRLDRRLQHPHPALYRPRPGVLQHHPQAGAQGGGRHRLRGRLAARHAAGQRRVVPQPRGEPGGDGALGRDPAAGAAVQQARPGGHLLGRGDERRPQPPQLALLRGLGGDRDGRLRDAQGDLALHPDGAQEAARPQRAGGARGGPSARRGSAAEAGRAPGRGALAAPWPPRLRRRRPRPRRRGPPRRHLRQ